MSPAVAPGAVAESGASTAGAVLMASTGDAFPPAVLDRAVELARQGSGHVLVLATARIWGTSLGMPHPGLYPTPAEWEAQRQIVADALRTLRRRGCQAHGRVVATRHAARVIRREARRTAAATVVIGRRPLPWWMRLLLQDEVARLLRRCRTPVHAVPVDSTSGAAHTRK